MEVKLILNPEGPDYQDLATGVKEELSALKGLTYEQITEPAPPKTLSLEHDVLMYVFNHPQVINLTTSLIQLVGAVLDRLKPRKDEAARAIIIAGDRRLKLPASASTQKKFVSSLQAKDASGTTEHKPKKSASSSPKKAVGRRASDRRNKKTRQSR